MFILNVNKRYFLSVICIFFLNDMMKSIFAFANYYILNRKTYFINKIYFFLQLKPYQMETHCSPPRIQVCNLILEYVRFLTAVFDNLLFYISKWFHIKTAFLHLTECKISQLFIKIY